MSLDREKRTHGGLAVLLACGLFWLFVPVTGAAAEPRVRLVVGILNYAGVPRETIHLAQAQVSRIWEEAGVDVEWWEPPRSDSPDSNRLAVKPAAYVKLLPASIFPPVPQPPSAWGCALGIQAFLFSGRIQEAAERISIPFPKILGHVMAHELGHILLGESSHALGSIMSPEFGEWEFRQMRWGALLFTPAQAHQIVDRIQVRKAAAAAPPLARSAE